MYMAGKNGASRIGLGNVAQHELTVHEGRIHQADFPIIRRISGIQVVIPSDNNDL